MSQSSVFQAIFFSFCGALGLSAADPVRVLVWDERQPEQKTAYGDKYLGGTIAEYLQERPDFTVRMATLNDLQQGLADATLDETDVLIFWSHRRVREQDEARAEAIVRRVMEGRLSLIALHSAHWAKPFVRLMQERAKADALLQVSAGERSQAKWEYLNADPYYQALPVDSPLTPVLKKEGQVWKLTLPQCVFPHWRADGAPSRVTTLLPEHPIAAGLPQQWLIAHTEMYGEPFHIPTPDEVIFREQWDTGEHFRSGSVWRVGKGRVFYFRPGHETFAVYQQPESLLVLENATRWLASESRPATSAKNRDDWGAYHIVSASTPEFVLEAVGGVQEGAAVSIQKPNAENHQKWIVVPTGEWVRVSPASDPSLVLAVENGANQNGTRIVLQKDLGKDWQRWSAVKHENGSYSLLAKHTTDQGLDHFGGKREAGARIDLWSYRADDVHLQWFIRPLTGSGVLEADAEMVSMYEPPAIAPEQILPGRIEKFTFDRSKIFPGTVREVTVFIPAQYDGSKPACVYVRTDGFNPFEQKMLETMIATKEIPVTVGVFVRPGELPAPIRETAGRRNRDFEYDGVSDHNVRFLVDELLPLIASEYQLNLSTDGNDRCMSGGSSGGIAAFTAAWHRPDAFSRVYAASGSWVAFRGGHEFPTMVRKFEAKPIRAFLTTATRDMENVAGDWFLLDQEMDKALKFSGYDYQFRIIDGRHVQGYAEHWREAMAYLWKDWPAPVAAGPSAPRAQEILIPGEDWELVAEGFKSTRGPACNAAGEIFFADTTNNKLHRIGVDGRVSTFVEDALQAHCVTVGADGKLYTISEKTDKLVSYDSRGNATVVMDGILGHSVLARPDGSLYVTSNGDKPHGPGSVWLIKDGKKIQVDTGIKFATGMAYRPDQWLLSVAEGHSKWVYSYQIEDDGALSNKERFFHLHVADWDDDAGPESLCYSREGRQFIATRSGIQISADDGPTQVILPVPDASRVTGVAIGGPEMDILYAFCMNKIWKRRIQQHGIGAFSPWTKVAPNKL